MTHPKEFFHPARPTITNLDLANFLIQLESRIMTKLQDLEQNLQAAVEKAITVQEGAIVLINGLADRIEAAGVDEKALSDLTEKIRAESDALSAAVVKNTPADTGATGVVDQPAANDGSTPAPEAA